EHGDGEGRVPVGWAVDHALLEEPVPKWCHGRHLPAQRLRDVAGAMRSWPEVSHGSHVCLLSRCEPIEPHAEETLVQLCERLDRGHFDVRGFDGGPTRSVPR